MRSLLGLAALMIGVVGCGQVKPAIDPAKFEPTYRAGKALESATSVGVNYQRFNELIQGLALELAIATDKAATEQERGLVSLYATALQTYTDSATVWAAKIQHGVILSPYNDGVSELMKKYGIESPFPTGNWNSDQAIQAIWAEARKHLSAANDVFNGKSQPQSQMVTIGRSVRQPPTKSSI